MKLFSNRVYAGICAIFIALLLLNANLHARICANGSGGVFGNDGERVNAEGNLIESYVIQGASYFLKSYRYAMIFSNRIEISELNGIDYSELSAIIDQTQDNLEMAIKTYKTLIKTAARSQYKKSVVKELENFDYDFFREQKGLNKAICKKAEVYLKKADIKGIYRIMYVDFKRMAMIIRTIKKDIKREKFPSIRKIWLLNETFSKNFLFGQYIARIFNELKSK
jgi:hypothetical protein